MTTQQTGGSGPPEPATYIEGRPANLPGAAYDALTWLEWVRDSSLFRALSDDNRAKFGLAITALQEQLRPHLPPVFQEEPSGVVFQVVEKP